jgi:hypothetical protein
MKKLLALSLSFVLVVLLGTLTFAAPAKGAKKATTKGVSHTFMGKVTDWSATQVTVEKKTGKTSKTETFTINDQTTKPADVKVGDQVTVTYKDEGGNKVATKITARAAKTGGAKKTTAKTKKS